MRRRRPRIWHRAFWQGALLLPEAPGLMEANRRPWSKPEALIWHIGFLFAVDSVTFPVEGGKSSGLLPFQQGPFFWFEARRHTRRVYTGSRR